MVRILDVCVTVRRTPDIHDIANGDGVGEGAHIQWIVEGNVHEWRVDGRSPRYLVQAVREHGLPHPPDTVEVGVVQIKERV